MKSCFYSLLCTTKLAIKNLWEKFSFNKLMFRTDESVRERVCRRFVIYLSASHILKNSRPIERTHMVLLNDKRGTFLCFLGIGFLAEAEVFEHGGRKRCCVSFVGDVAFVREHSNVPNGLMLHKYTFQPIPFQLTFLSFMPLAKGLCFHQPLMSITMHSLTHGQVLTNDGLGNCSRAECR